MLRAPCFCGHGVSFGDARHESLHQVLEFSNLGGLFIAHDQIDERLHTPLQGEIERGAAKVSGDIGNVRGGARKDIHDP